MQLVRPSDLVRLLGLFHLPHFITSLGRRTIATSVQSCYMVWNPDDPEERKKRIAWSVATSTCIETREDPVLIYNRILREYETMGTPSTVNITLPNGTKSTIEVTLGDASPKEAANTAECSNPTETNNKDESQETHNKNKECERCHRRWCSNRGEHCAQ